MFLLLSHRRPCASSRALHWQRWVHTDDAADRPVRPVSDRKQPGLVVLCPGESRHLTKVAQTCVGAIKRFTVDNGGLCHTLQLWVLTCKDVVRPLIITLIIKAC